MSLMRLIIMMHIDPSKLTDEGWVEMFKQLAENNRYQSLPQTPSIERRWIR